jgi:hypothetical protein
MIAMKIAELVVVNAPAGNSEPFAPIWFSEALEPSLI